MNKAHREALINEDFGWLKDLAVHEHDGKMMLGDEYSAYNISAVIREKDFIKNWFMSFAIANTFRAPEGKSYFDLGGWGKLSNRGTRSVMVVDETNTPVFVIAPLVSHNMSEDDFKILRRVAQEIDQIQADNMRKNDPNASMGIAQWAAEGIKAKPRKLQDLIPDWFYQKHGIIPKVEQSIYYIKDVLREGKAPIEDINRSRDILYRNHRKEPVSREEYEFIHQLSKGEFIIPEGIVNKTTGDGNDVPDTPDNPLEC